MKVSAKYVMLDVSINPYASVSRFSESGSLAGDIGETGKTRGGMPR